MVKEWVRRLSLDINSLLEFPLKLVIFVLNFIPVGVWEVHGARGHSATDQPDLRSLHIHIKGHRTLHLGSWLIAYQRGAIVRAPLSTTDPKVLCWGVYEEDYKDIQGKWTF